MKARFKAARFSASIGRLKSRPVTSAPVCSVKGAIVNERIDEPRANLPDAIATRRRDQYGRNPDVTAFKRCKDCKTQIANCCNRPTVEISNKQKTNNYKQRATI